ncbi:MAG: DegV family protein [Acidimicrobiales bacterium]
MTVSIITDSAASIPADVAAAWNVTVIPLRLTLGSTEARDGDVPIHDVLAHPPSETHTSGPPPGEFTEAIDGADAEGAVVLTISSHMSSTYEAARLGARMTTRPSLVVDTGTAAGAQGLVVLAAARRAAAGGSIAQVEAVARQAIRSVRLVASVATLERLVQSGRVPEIAGWAGRVLGLHPLFEFRAGKVHRLAPAKGREQAVNAMLRRFRHERRPGIDTHIAVLHADDLDGAEDLLKRVHSEVEPTSAFVGEFSPVMVAHTGPLLGLAWHLAAPS